MFLMFFLNLQINVLTSMMWTDQWRQSIFLGGRAIFPSKGGGRNKSEARRAESGGEVVGEGAAIRAGGIAPPPLLLPRIDATGTDQKLAKSSC